MDAIEFTAWVAEQIIPDDGIPADIIGEDREDAEADIIGDIDEDQLLECLSTYREIVKEARKIRDLAMMDFDGFDSMGNPLDGGPMIAETTGILYTVTSPEDAAWIINTKERDHEG